MKKKNILAETMNDRKWTQELTKAPTLVSHPIAQNFVIA